MNRETAKRLHDALSAAQEIQRYAASTTREQFLEDRSLELIFERLFEIVGEAISKAEDEYPELRARIPDVGDITLLECVTASRTAMTRSTTSWSGLQRSTRYLSCADNSSNSSKKNRSIDPYGASKSISACVPSQKGLFFE